MALVRWRDDRWWPSWKRAFAPAGQPEGLSAELRGEARELRGALLRGMACRAGCTPKNPQPTRRDGQRRSDRLVSNGEAEGSDARGTGRALRGCGVDDDEDMTIDQWLALDGEGPMSEDESGSETASDDTGSDPSSDESEQGDAEQDVAYDAIRVRSVRRRGQLQALIEWSGSDSNGVPWKHSWEPVQDIGPGLQQEAQAMWERAKMRRRGKGRRPGSKLESVQPEDGAAQRAASVAARQRADRAARANRGRRGGDKQGPKGPTTRKRSRGDGN